MEEEREKAALAWVITERELAVRHVTPTRNSQNNTLRSCFSSPSRVILMPPWDLAVIDGPDRAFAISRLRPDNVRTYDPALRILFLVFRRRFERVQQFRIGGEALERADHVAGAETGSH